MRLERLEISGFKSFSDRAELAFDRGVTAIVGPNGCGKSNVADAITWVLGEQSAKSLRGDRMEDVIFSGSDARRPGAAAEVRLRLSGLAVSSRSVVDQVSAGTHAGGASSHDPAAEHTSADGPVNGNGNGNGHHGNGADVEALLDEFTRNIEVTRRLYRSGESEYLIDGEVCRLRDVHELLMDTGLGAKAYAIIEQGKIGMILSSRPTDRRQLIEEAAGITKYKSRRRAAELKLEAAQQNLTRVDDIVFEVEKQRGVLKRQAAKARRYRRLREELRRWEKVLLARRYRELAHSIDAARTRLTEAREREALASAHLSQVESDLGRMRIELVEADARATAIREDGHSRELAINRLQQQQEFQRHQSETLAARAEEIAQEIADLEARREPARIAIESRRQAQMDAMRAREEAEAVRRSAGDDLARSQQQIDALEGDVDATRSSVYDALSSVNALRHALQHAGTQYERVGDTLAKLDVEEDGLRRELATVTADRRSAADVLERARLQLDDIRADRVSRESALAEARAAHDARIREIRTREQELAAAEARLASLEELATSRAEFGDAARMVLVHANGRVGQQGAVADYLEVEGRFERAVEACLGDLLQHVIVERHEQAAEGLSLVREQQAGRCGFVVVDPESNGYHARETLRVPGILSVADVVRVTGPHAATILKVLPEAYVAETFEQAVVFSRQTPALVATPDGDVLRGPHLVSGGARVESRGILATRREIKELRERTSLDRQALTDLIDEAARLQQHIADATSAIGALLDEQHRVEISIVGAEAQVARAAEDMERLERKADLIAVERRSAEEERTALEGRRAEADASIGRFEDIQRQAEDRLGDAQRRLGEARETSAQLGTRAADAGAAHAALVERASALESEVTRLQESSRELEQRVSQRLTELQQMHDRREALMTSAAEGARALDEAIHVLDGVHGALRIADEAAAALRATVDGQDSRIRDARGALEDIRADAGGLEVARATAESDLTHLAQGALDSMQVSLDEVVAEVELLEQSGQAVPDAAAIAADEPDPDAEDAPAGEGEFAGAAPVAAAPAVPSGSMSADEAISALKAKIDRLGPVNMMAIEQFDELETRHTFLTAQRTDLISSISQTSEAISRIDETSKARFTEAFAAIQENFQKTFSTLFGGGRAGLTLLDENDPLESGIDIVASPPGKRLQSVQLLSGGEKALTAIALMFAIFRYKPSPFCLLDEIDAPLDDANVSRFVEMLRGMLDRTQFILITHNRRTMEIANRLYGVTMEEPGVSKLISVNLN